MIAEKRKANGVPRNSAFEKIQLMSKINEAQQEGRVEEALELQEQLQKMKELAEQQEDSSRLEIWTSLNSRNRQINLAEGSPLDT